MKEGVEIGAVGDDLLKWPVCELAALPEHLDESVNHAIRDDLVAVVLPHQEVEELCRPVNELRLRLEDMQQNKIGRLVAAHSSRFVLPLGTEKGIEVLCTQGFNDRIAEVRKDGGDTEGQFPAGGVQIVRQLAEILLLRA